MRVSTYDIKLRDTVDRTVFLATFLIGVLGTVILKSQWVNANAVILAFFPVLVLCSYAVYCAISRTAKIEPETAGDNCYYLGFLFTLSSLAVTLYRVNNVSETSGVQQFDIAEVISGFGVALTSTIVGVLLRVLFFQMRPDFVVADKEARTELSKGVREFRKQLTAVSRDLNQLSTTFSQHVTERNAKFLDAIAEQQAKTDEILKERLEKVSTAFESLPAELSTKFAGGIQDGLSRMTTELDASFKDLKSTLDEVARAQQGGATVVGSSSTKLGEAMGEFEGVLQSVKGRLTDGAASMSEVSDKLERNQELIDKLVEKLDDRALKLMERERRWWWFGWKSKTEDKAS